MPAKFPDGSALKRYDLPSVGAEGWASIVIGADGFLASVGDFYDFAHYRPHHGCEDFREFLIAMRPESLLAKISRKIEYDGEATVKQIRQCIIDLRRGKVITKEDAREEWDGLDSLGVEFDERALVRWADQTTLESDEAEAVYTYHPFAIDFIRQTWPRFVEMLRRELAAEAKTMAILGALPPGDAGGNI